MAAALASVLFADRDLAWSREARDILRRRGISVFAATSTREVLRLARQHAPDVIVLDEDLEEMGTEVCLDLLRSQSPASRILLACSGERDRGHLRAERSVAKPAEPEALLRAVEDAAGAGALEASRAKLIVCVDDDAAFLRGLSRLLRRHGYDVLPFQSPESALEAAPFVKPDLFIFDVRMPGMTGLDLAEELREREGKQPLLFLSAAGSDDEIAQGYRSGARGYLVKPCDPRAVLGLAEELLRRSSA